MTLLGKSYYFAFENLEQLRNTICFLRLIGETPCRRKVASRNHTLLNHEMFILYTYTPISISGWKGVDENKNKEILCLYYLLNIAYVTFMFIIIKRYY